MSNDMRARLLEGLDAEEKSSTRSAGCSTWRMRCSSPGSSAPTSRTTPGSGHSPGSPSSARPPEFFEEIRRGDILVHHPYESFATSFEAFVRGAAKDRNVLGLKTTVYRTSDETPLVPALIDAAEEGKQSVCLVELKARFDEHRNIEWSRALERSGVHVVYGFPNLKIHAKATLIVRREGEDLRRYVHVGTATTTRVQRPRLRRLRAVHRRPEISADVADFFNYVTGFGRPQRFRKILVSPFALRACLIEEIRSVAQSAEAGKKAGIRIKVNALTDQAVIEELYEASQAGARSTSSSASLRPPAGRRGMSENIRVRSILGRYLEHSRLFISSRARR